MPRQPESRENREEPGRRPYQAPEIARVELEAEEVLSIGCKTTRHVNASGFTINCIARPCAGAGS